MTEELTVQNAQAMATIGGNPWSDPKAFAQIAKVADAFSKSSLVPQNYQGKPQDCMIAIEMANRMNISPVFVMQNLYIVKGKPSWAGQACMAMINACGKFKDVKHVYTGTKGTDSRGCYVTATRISDGERVDGTEVTMALVKAEGWISNSKWKNMPEQMLGYRAASFFARMYCPEALMGLQTYEEVEDASPRKSNANALSDALKADTVVIDGELICEMCGKPIAAFGQFSAEQVAQLGVERYHKRVCVDCGAKLKAAQAEQDGAGAE